MRRLLLVVCAALLAGCQPAEVTLSVDPGFYPAAVAHDPSYDRFFVASYSSGEVIVVRRDGSRIATVRPRGAPAPVEQLSYDHKSRRLWVLTPHTVEIVELMALPVRRTVAVSGGDAARFSDLTSDDPERAYVLNVATREVLEVSASRQTARPIARLPERAAGEAIAASAPSCASARADGALMLMPDRMTLLAAAAGRLWRIDRRSGAVDEIPLGAPLPHVSQLVLIGTDAVAHHVAALRGRANEVVALRLAPDARRAVVDDETRARFDTPLHGAFDGRRLVVLIGRLRHHPDFCGDGRPNLPARLANYFPLASTASLNVAHVPTR